MGDATTPTTSAAGLHVVRRADGPAGPPVVVVHGFTQDHRCLGPLGEALAARGELVAVDAPGHGGSRHLGAADLPTTGRLLAGLAQDLGDRVDLVGYSMGGRMALQTAVDHPGVVRRVVLVGATPGIEDPVARAARAEQDRATADRIESEGLDRFVEDWLAGPLFAGLPEEFRFTDVRRAQDPAALAAQLRVAGTGSMVPLWDRLDGLDVPVRCLAGALDARFAETAGRMAGLLPRADAVVVDGAGHAAHLERPDEVVRLVLEHLDA